MVTAHPLSWVLLVLLLHVSLTDATSYLETCNPSTGICQIEQCNDAADCSSQNTECLNGQCACVEGYSQLNTACAKVLGRACVSDVDCDYNRTTCRDNECVCENQYSEDNDVCVPYYGQPCDHWEQCTTFTGLDYYQDYMGCFDGVCNCSSGYEWINEVCTQIFWRRCSSYTDCSHESVYCHNNYCRCLPEMTYSSTGNGCIYRLGTNCDQMWDCNEANNMFCNVDNICTCMSGMMEVDHWCVGVLERECITDADCGDSPAYICSAEGNCSCASGFLPAPASGEGDYFGDVCQPELGEYCTTHDDCETEFSICDDYTCACGVGYFEADGFCKKVLGANCQRDETCQLLPGTRCGLLSKCECAEGYQESADQLECIAVTDCTLSSECSAGQTCQKDRCIPACHDGVPDFPSSHHRGWQYVVSPNSEEPLLDDSYLEGPGWWSTGIWEPWSPGSGDPPALGQCGTYHPIFLQDALTDQQRADMATSEVSATAIVGGTSETLSVRLRKCGHNTHAYFNPPSTKMSALCITRPLTYRESYTQRSYTGSMWVQAKLVYKSAVIDGANWHIPVLWFYSTSYSTWGDRYFYMMNWYANGKFVKAMGPVQGRDLNNDTSLLDLMEDDLWENGGYRAGCTVQSSLQIMETLDGPLSGEQYSNIYKTGVTTNEWYGYHQIYSAGDANPAPAAMTHAPIGCITAEDDTALFCHHGYDFADEDGNSICSDNLTNTADHPNCGLVLSGLTYKGQQQVYSAYYMNTNEGSVRVNSRRGLLIQTNSAEPHSLTNILSAKFLASSTAAPVHAFWEDYEPPELFFKVHGITGSHFSCYMNQQGGVQIMNTRQTNWNSGQVPITRAGKFIALHDQNQPVQIQIETEDCTDESYGTRVCVCAVTVREGNGIYTKSICGDIKQEGTVYGDATLAFSPRTGYYGDASFYSGNLNPSISSTASEVNIYGLCSAETGNYKMRSGETTENWDEFLESWRVLEGEDLLDPATHVDYEVTEETYHCTCPDIASDVPDHVIASERSNYRTEYEYTSAIHCSLQKLCIKETAGIAWPSDLVPVSSVGEVNVSARMDVPTGRPALTFTCNFVPDPNYQYKVEWQADDILIDTFGPYDAAGVLANSELTVSKLTEGEFVSTHGEFAVLDAEVVCGVIQISGGVESPIVYSEPYTAVGVPFSELNILRGGQTTLTIHKNLDLLSGNDPVEWDFTIYDEDDENLNCLDSQIAVTGSNLCGTRISGKPIGIDRAKRDTDKTVTMTLRNVNNRLFSLKDTFTLRLKTVVRYRGIKYWSYVLRQAITVFVRDDGYWQRRLCYANNDPNMMTFDGLYWYMNGNGTYTMYRSLLYPVEVQLIVRPCNGGWGTCSCGVILRAGSDVYMVNHCDGTHMIDWLKKGTSELKVFKRSNTKFQFYFPHGTQVDITFSPWRWYLVNVYIYASPADLSNVEGLCGFFNGDPTDDWRLPNGEQDPVKPVRFWWWWRSSPTVFTAAWKLSDEGSLLNLDVLDGLSDWPAEDQLCKCAGSHDSEDVVCSANEEDTCNNSWEPPGLAVSRDARAKRSTGPVLNNDMRRRVGELRERLKDTGTGEDSRVKRSTEARTDEEAQAECEKMNDPTYCPSLDKADMLEADKNGTLIKCFSDNLLNKEVSWSKEACYTLQNQLETVARKDPEFQENHPTELQEVTSYCDGDCSNNGVCENGKCRCNPGYSSDCCTINQAVPPTPLRIYGNGLCDTSTDGDCTCIHITTDGNADTVMCRVDEFEAVKDNTKFEVSDTYDVPAIVMELNELYCCIRSQEDGRRRKRAVGSGSGVVAQGAQIALSNDNTTFSDGQYVFVLDATCQEVQNETDGYTLILKAGYCYIHGTCYNDTTTSATGCGVCNTTYSLFDWQETCQASAVDNDDNDDQVLIIGISVGVAVVVMASIGVIVTIIAMKKTKVKPDINMGLYDGVKGTMPNKKFILRVEPGSEKWM